MLFCAIWYHLYSLKNVKNAHRGVLILVKLQASACNFTKGNTLPWVLTFFKLNKWYQIAQHITIDSGFFHVQAESRNQFNNYMLVAVMGKQKQSETQGT